MLRRRPALVALLLAVLAGGVRAEPPLQALARHAGDGQPVYAQAADGTVLVSQAADRAVHPASVTKVATTLALLERLGPTHRFETRLLAGGRLQDGTLAGDLVVEAVRDPFLVYESAFLLLRRLRAQGLGVVDGRLVTRGPLLFNWQPDPEGRRLALALAGREGREAWAAAASIGGVGGPATLREAALVFRDRAGLRTVGAERVLAVHRSPPLLDIVKHLNGYSNNVFHLVSPVIGGPKAVEAVARSHVPEDVRDEILIDNGAGGGETNRMSARAAVAVLAELGRLVRRQGHELTDVLPVSGVDPGTLDTRLLDPPARRAIVVGKTGTFGSVGSSALAGVLRTRRWGEVTFAVLNTWVPVPQARKRQDAFVTALIAATEAEPWPYTTPVRPTFTTAAQVE